MISKFLLSVCCDAPIRMSDGNFPEDFMMDIRGIHCVCCGRRIDEVTNEGIFHFGHPESCPQWELDLWIQDMGTTITP